jgi:uncharacterized protein YceK
MKNLKLCALIIIAAALSGCISIGSKSNSGLGPMSDSDNTAVIVSANR